MEYQITLPQGVFDANSYCFHEISYKSKEKLKLTFHQKEPSSWPEIFLPIGTYSTLFLEFPLDEISMKGGKEMRTNDVIKWMNKDDITRRSTNDVTMADVKENGVKEDKEEEEEVGVYCMC